MLDFDTNFRPKKDLLAGEAAGNSGRNFPLDLPVTGSPIVITNKEIIMAVTFWNDGIKPVADDCFNNNPLPFTVQTKRKFHAGQHSPADNRVDSISNRELLED